MKWFRTKAQNFTGILVSVLCFLPGLVSCQEQGFLTPPAQLFGGSLNSLSAEQAPRFSYDGRYIVFASDRQGQRRILLYDVQQRGLINLPGLNQPKIMYDQPDISADGRYIAYISEERGKPDVFVYDRQTFQSEVITENLNFEVSHPTISGNGRFVSFAANRSGQWDIEIYDRGTDTELSLPQK
ncbi:TolB family protein [Merismopedia glauca]|uniref:Biopolymer transporter n=1 Tax=Merismopedia glauca CCAP 1448/3 TaxID=1296344 RepID=A0A2T1CAC1_9CYAN|nr:TolB family protein [Merismopedia glauca]PSB05083.1 biopolymer transporter [Merismopedia glauca CCAP 1448/3]